MKISDGVSLAVEISGGGVLSRSAATPPASASGSEGVIEGVRLADGKGADGCAACKVSVSVSAADADKLDG